MGNSFTKYISKALLAISSLILKQVAAYVSSEEFMNLAKKAIKGVVASMVKLVMSEQNKRANL